MYWHSSPCGLLSHCCIIKKWVMNNVNGLVWFTVLNLSCQIFLFSFFIRCFYLFNCKAASKSFENYCETYCLLYKLWYCRTLTKVDYSIKSSIVSWIQRRTGHREKWENSRWAGGSRGPVLVQASQYILTVL